MTGEITSPLVTVVYLVIIWGVENVLSPQYVTVKACAFGQNTSNWYELL